MAWERPTLGLEQSGCMHWLSFDQRLVHLFCEAKNRRSRSPSEGKITVPVALEFAYRIIKFSKNIAQCILLDIINAERPFDVRKIS
jgi:hypothetical protein